MATIERHSGYPKFTYGETKAAEDCWQVFTTDSDLEVLGLLAASAPAFYMVEGVAVFMQSYTPEYQDGGFWLVNVRYAERPGNQPQNGGDAGSGGIISFETGGQTIKITQALLTRQALGLGGAAVDDHKKAIGWDGEQVNGCDVVTPIFHWTETHQLPNSTAGNLAYHRALELLTGTVNAEAFRGREALEVLFMGASGARKNDGIWEISFKFASSRNQEDLTIGDIGGVNKKGWDYLDIRYAARVDVKFRAPRPVEVRVQKVYEAGDFTQLQIGTGGV